VRPLTYFTLGKLWTAAKPVVAPWAGGHSTWTFRYVLQDAAEAHAAFLSGTRRFPRFKSRRTDRAGFTVADGLRLEAGRLRLAKYGWVRIAAPCAVQAKLRWLLRRGYARLLNISVSRHSDGRWYATVCYAREQRLAVAQHIAPAGPVVGLDRGVKTAAVVAISQREPVAELASVRALRDALRHVKHLQRAVSRAEKGSANRRKAVARLGGAHARVGAVRADALHNFTAGLARDHAVVVVEDLKTRNLMANHSLAQAIGDQGWGELARQLDYKTVRHGGRLLVAGRWFASSKTCSACGAVRSKLTLAERTYRCGNDGCGLVCDRGVNAAANLAAWGEHELGLCLCSPIQVGDRHPGGSSGTGRSHACGGRVSAVTELVAAVPLGEAGTSRPHASAGRKHWTPRTGALTARADGSAITPSP
jgi:putative transposase